MGLRNVLRAGLRDRGVKLPDFLLKDDEPFMRSVARSLKPGDVVIDLGAHVGHASIEFSHYCDKVYAFEPHPEIFEALKTSVRHYPKITPVNAAVSDKTGRAKLFFEPPNKGKTHYEGSSLVTDKDNLSYDNAVEVDTLRLSDFVEGLSGRVALIKMDIEGAEYRVLSDFIETAAVARVDKVYIECHVGRVAGLEAERAAFEARIAELGIADKFDFDWP